MFEVDEVDICLNHVLMRSYNFYLQFHRLYFLSLTIVVESNSFVLIKMQKDKDEFMLAIYIVYEFKRKDGWTLAFLFI